MASKGLMNLRCHSCGASSFMHSTFDCADCHRKVCQSCYRNARGEGLCKQCYDRRFNHFCREIQARYDGTCPICKASGSVQIPAFSIYRHREFQYINEQKCIMFGPLLVDARVFCISCKNVIDDRTISILRNAQRAEEAGRYEDAARGFESLNFLERAKSLREQGRQTSVKHVNVDVNELIDQLRTGGLSIPYKCHSCGATIAVNGAAGEGGARFCSYCGTAVNTEALQEILRGALGD